MSKVFNFINIQGSSLNLEKEAISFLNSKKEEVALVTIISSTDSKDVLNSLKLSVLRNITNSNLNDSNSSVTLYSSQLKKENTGASLLFANIKNCNKYLLSSLFLSSSLFIFVIQGSVSEKEISKFKLFSSLSSTIELQQSRDKEGIFTESSPKCIFYISQTDSSIQNNYPKDYLDSELRKKSNEAEISLIKESIIRYFPDRDCIFDSQNQADQLLLSKITREMNPKTIRGKLFNGESLAYFLKRFSEMQKQSGNPNFDNLWNDLIHKDLEVYKTNAINYFQNELNNNFQGLEDEENLIAGIYNAKINAIEKFNEIYDLNIDTFNNPEYRTWYTQTKSDVETEFKTLEEMKISDNSRKSETVCKQLLNKYYSNIKNKVTNRQYNGQNTDEYLKDYEKFINDYKNNARGNMKLKCLIEFLEENKPEYFKCLVENIEKENESKLRDANQKLEESKKKKQQQEEQYKELNDKTEENSKKVDEINSQIQSKKREIANLNEEIQRVENEIKEAQAQGQQISGIPPTNQDK